MPARTPKIEAFVVNAIRRLQDVQGSTSREISNYISQEYNIPGKEIRRQVQIALQRGLAYGILQRSKGGYYACNRDYLGNLSFGDGTGDGVMEPCAKQPWRRGRFWRRRRGRRGRSRSRGRARGRRRRRRSRAKSRARRGRSRRRRRRRRSRRRGRRGKEGKERARTRADSGEIEMETVAAESSKGNGASEDRNPRESGTCIAEHSDERDAQGSSRNSRHSNTPDDDV